MIDFDLLKQAEEDGEQDPKRFYGVTTGTVINLADPMFMSRVQVQMKFIDDLDLAPWARVATPMAGIATGMYFIPQIGDEVLLAFEHGDVNVPYIIGSLWNALSPPPLPTPLAQMRTIRTIVGNQILIQDVPPSIQIITPTGAAVNMGLGMINMLASAGLTITVGDVILTIAPDGVNIVGAKTIKMAATTAIMMAAPTISITAAGVCNIQAATAVNINS